MNDLIQFKGSFDGFRLVLIGDIHEQPMLHLKVKPFIAVAKDWSGEVRTQSVRRASLNDSVVAHYGYHGAPNHVLEPDEFTLGTS